MQAKGLFRLKFKVLIEENNKRKRKTNDTQQFFVYQIQTVHTFVA